MKRKLTAHNQHTMAPQLPEQLGRFSNHSQLLLVVFGVVIVVLMTANIILLANRNDVPVTTQSAVLSDTRILPSLGTFSTATAIITVSNVKEDASEDKAFPLAESETMLIADLSVTNVSGAEQHLIPASQLFVHDRDGGLYQLHASSHVTNPLGEQLVPSGGKVTGQVSFAIPKRQTKPLLFVDLGWDDHTPAVFDVLH